MSSHLTETSPLLDLSLFVSLSTSFLRASSWAPGTVTIQCLIPVTTLVDIVCNDFARRLPGAHAPRGTNAKNRTRDSARVNYPKLLKRSMPIDIIRVTRRDRDGGEQTALKKQRVSSRGVYMWSVNSTVTKHFLCLKGHVKARDSTL